MTSPWLSVVMPVHDGEQFLEATLQSVADAAPSGVEIIMLDSSTDPAATRNIAQRFANLLDMQWHGARDAPSWMAKTNRGVGLARAPQIVMLHQDDLWRPGHVQALLAARNAAPDAAMSIGPSCFIDAEGRPIGHWRLPFATGLLPTGTALPALLVQNAIAIPSPMISRDRWHEVGGLDETLWYTADWDLYLKLARRGSVMVRPWETTAFRLHAHSLTMTGARSAEDFRNQLSIVLDRHLPFLPADARSAIEGRARASLEINCLLASSTGSMWARCGKVGRILARLGTVEASAYLRQSRLVDRAVPRLRLRLKGKL